MEPSRVVTLSNSSMLKLIDWLPHYLPQLEELPSNLKDKVIHLMSKRGLFTDHSLSIVLHPKLRVLDLSEAEQVSDVGLLSVASCCPQLRKIDLNATKGNRANITDTGVCAVARSCRYLQVVYLRRCLSLTDASICALAEGCPTLRDLNLGGCTQEFTLSLKHVNMVGTSGLSAKITDESMRRVGECSRYLRSINLTKTSVTDQGVFCLAQGVCQQSLKEVHLVGCTRLTDESVEALLQFCPQLNILLFHGCPHITEQSRIAMEEYLSGRGSMKQITWTIY